MLEKEVEGGRGMNCFGLILIGRLDDLFNLLAGATFTSVAQWHHNTSLIVRLQSRRH